MRTRLRCCLSQILEVVDIPAGDNLVHLREGCVVSGSVFFSELAENLDEFILNPVRPSPQCPSSRTQGQSTS